MIKQTIEIDMSADDVEDLIDALKKRDGGEAIIEQLRKGMAEATRKGGPHGVRIYPSKQYNLMKRRSAK